MSDDLEKFKKLGAGLGSQIDALNPIPLHMRDALKQENNLSKFGVGSTIDNLPLAGVAIRNLMASQKLQEDLRTQQINNTANIMVEHHRRIAEAQHQRDNPVLAVFEELQSYIKEFESSLKDDEIVGARLVTFGNDTKFLIERLGYSTPCLIHFDGTDQDGNRVRLVQNITQLNVLFVAMRLPTGQEKKPIGFVHPS